MLGPQPAAITPLSKSAVKSSLCCVLFRVKLATEHGETVRVAGSCPELGNWDPSYGVELVTEPGFPCWYTPEAVSLPIRRRVDYKYVILGLDGSVHRWESYPENRTIIPTDDDGAGRSVLPNPPLPRPVNDVRKEPVLELPRGSVDDGNSSHNASVSSHRHLGLHMSRREPSDVVRELHEADIPPVMHENVMLLIVSFELPLKVIRTPQGELRLEKQKSLVMPQLHALRNAIRVPVKFVGWPGIVTEDVGERSEIEQLLEPHDCVPVFLSFDALKSFLEFTHQCLWPLFHNVLVLDSKTIQSMTTDGWNWYQYINRLYAEAAVRQAHEADLIWVHDFHLLLVPQYITRRIRNANVGFFLHTPFPSSEIFRCLPMREEILRGMLFADLIGFHFFEYARHFLVANKRQLGIDHHFRMGGFLELDYGGRNVMLKIGHVHVQYDELRRVVDGSEKVETRILEIRKQHEGRFIFASIDRCEHLAGIALKLKAFQNFLRNYSYAQRRAVLIQFAYPTSHAWEPPEAYRDDIERLAQDINKEFGNPQYPAEGPVILEIRSFTPEEKYALFAAADCLLDTSIRDGLNLNPFEYISCRKDDPAPLILSEFTGCCRTLASAIRVNPWRVEDITQALDRAMNTPNEELADRFLRDQMYLERNSTLQWAEEFLVDLQRARKKDDLVYVSWGFGQSYRVLGMDSHFQYLNCDHVIQAFRVAKRRVFFFDHEGTLAPDRRRITAVPGYETLSATGAAPSAEVQRCLRALCAAGNIVIILSGRDRSLLSEWFGGIAGIGLCAEHGFYYKVPAVSGDQWKCLTSLTGDFTWKAIAMELMRQYVKRTQGSFIENKGSALVFQYRDADPDFGSWQAKELSNYLEELLFGSPVTVMSGKGYVEVKLRGVNKGQAVQTLLHKLSAVCTTPIDFILCIGDDRSDEDMFPVVNSFFDGTVSVKSDQRNGSGFCKRSTDFSDCFSPDMFSRRSLSMAMSGEKRPTSVKLPIAFSVTVGKKPSSAKHYLNDVEDVSDLLEALALNKLST